MTVKFSSRCRKELKRIKQRNTVLFKRIEKQLTLFYKYPNHPSLRLHKLSGSQQEAWSISVDMSVRMLFYYHQSDGEKYVVFFSVGTHDEVYE